MFAQTGPDGSAARATTATVLSDPSTGTYHTLNEAAGPMWDALEDQGDVMNDVAEHVKWFAPLPEQLP